MDNPTASKYIAAAKALADSDWYNDIPTEARNMMTDAITTMQAQIEVNPLADVWNYAGTSVAHRNYFGGLLHGTDQVEQEANTILDLTAIFTTWGTDPELADYQWQAYQQIMAMPDAIHKALDIKSAADRDSYQALRQAKWDLLQTADLEGVNAVLTRLGLETIATAEPEYTLGDVNNDGKISDFDDIIAAIQFFQKLQKPTETELKAADIDGDGKVGFSDIIEMIRYFNRDITEFNTQQ